MVRSSDGNADSREPSLDARETFESESEEDEESYQSGDEEDDDTSFLKDLQESWKQHAVAVLIAVMATMLAHRHFSFSWASLGESILFEQPHKHLEDYQRLSHWSFCEGALELRERNPNLEIFRVDVPRALLPTIHRLYAADVLQDDNYDRVIEMDDAEVARIASDHPEVVCVHKQFEASKSIAFGWSVYYKTPDFQSMYQKPSDIDSQDSIPIGSMNRDEGSLKPAPLSFTGFAAVFVNRSPKPLILYWDNVRADTPQMVGEIAPWDSLTTATTPGSSFSVTPVYDPSTALARWTVTADAVHLVYESTSDENRLSVRDQRWRGLLDLQVLVQRDYLIASKRPYLANIRPPPMHPYWDANYMGQRHAVHLEERSTTLTAVSVTPRVFEVEDFLTPNECRDLIAVAHGVSDGFQPSTVVTGTTAQSSRRHMTERHNETRSSSNIWLDRHHHFLVDEIYRRASRIFQVDESLLRNPPLQRDSPVPARFHALAESLQVVQYKAHQQYTAHHDFVNAPFRHRYQPLRFATLLLYLNDDFTGGHTSFPRAVNAQHHEGISVTPKAGKAVLFYNVLPDGNADDLSQHAGEPVQSGTKYVANIWLWEPLIH